MQKKGPCKYYPIYPSYTLSVYKSSGQEFKMAKMKNVKLNWVTKVLASCQYICLDSITGSYRVEIMIR